MDSTGSDVPEFIRTVQRRLDIVDELVDAPREMREMVESVEESRSTVRRAIRRLEDFGFVERTESGYRATLRGRLAADTCREYIDRLVSIKEMEDALTPLPPTFPVESAMILDGEAHVATGPAPYRPLEPIKPVFRETKHFRSMNAGIPNPWFIEQLHTQIVEGDLIGELIVTPDVRNALIEQFSAIAADLAASGQCSVLLTEPFHFGLLIAEADDTHVFLLVGHKDGTVHATIHATSTAAREWATDMYQRFRKDATDITETFVSNNHESES